MIKVYFYFLLTHTFVLERLFAFFITIPGIGSFNAY